MVKKGWGFRDHGTLKSGVSHKWFDELSRLIEWFLCTDSHGMVFGLTSNLLCIFDIYFVLILSIWLTIKPINLRKFYSQISEKHDQSSIFADGSYKISFVHLSICLSVFDTFFSGSSQVLNFLHEDIFLYMLKSCKARFWKHVSVS